MILTYILLLDTPLDLFTYLFSNKCLKKINEQFELYSIKKMLNQ